MDPDPNIEWAALIGKHMKGDAIRMIDALETDEQCLRMIRDRLKLYLHLRSRIEHEVPNGRALLLVPPHLSPEAVVHQIEVLGTCIDNVIRVLYHAEMFANRWVEVMFVPPSDGRDRPARQQELCQQIMGSLEDIHQEAAEDAAACYAASIPVMGGTWAHLRRLSTVLGVSDILAPVFWQP